MNGTGSGKRILGVDYGRKRVGIALSDPMKFIARGLTVVENCRSLIPNICTIISDEGVGEVVVGLPLTLKGEKGPMAVEVERFIGRLGAACGLPVIAFDERHSSNDALSSMIGMGVTKKKRRARGEIDRVASALILQSYLDTLHHGHDLPHRRLPGAGRPDR
ncbi:MAG TPA: Holliday junction resolvase RuvX [Bacteroidota bacterium]|nr:Holliday junction resolvase RuvX [Bacteroidota bacterium]